MKPILLLTNFALIPLKHVQVILTLIITINGISGAMVVSLFLVFLCRISNKHSGNRITKLLTKLRSLKFTMGKKSKCLNFVYLSLSQ